MMHTPYVDVAVLVEDGEDPGRMASTFVESVGKRGELRTSQRRVIVSILERERQQVCPCEPINKKIVC